MEARNKDLRCVQHAILHRKLLRGQSPEINAIVLKTQTGNKLPRDERITMRKHLKVRESLINCNI